MRRMAVVLAAVASLAWVSIGLAGSGHDHGAAKATTTVGELVDMGCYVAHSAKGAKHADCASKCIAGGMPMGVLTQAGDLYLLTMDHTNPDPYNKAKEMAGKKVKVHGPIHTKNGVKTIDVLSAEVMPAVASAK